jgi:cobalamin-dependent methionine synthase I
MIIIGERINTSRPGVEPAVRERNAAYIQNEVAMQLAAGATIIDVNTGTLLDEEPEALAWIVKVAQETEAVPLCIDSPNPAAIKAALAVCKGKAVVNSISGEGTRYQEIVPLVKQYGTGVVVLTMDDGGIPSTSSDRIKVAGSLIERLTADGVSVCDIYIDPLVQPISTDRTQCLAVTETISATHKLYPGIHTTCGLSNVSFGLPARKLLNRTCLSMFVAAGLDSVICDPLDKEMMKAIYAANVLVGRDDFCVGYISAYRSGRLI